MLKRKFNQFECIFCLGDEEFAYVDANEFQLCNVYKDTRENVAICLKQHEKKPNNNFTHFPLGCKLENPDAFIEFLETKKCGENTDFVEWKSVLSYLGCSKKIMDKLKQQSCIANDEISIVSAFYAFETVQNNRIEQVQNFTLSLDRLHFFMAYGYLYLTLTRTVSPPQNVPQELLDKLKPDEIILNGFPVFPGMNFVESIFVNVIILNTCNQYENCKKMCQLLLDLKFVIIVESLIHWRCIPPFDKISQWNPIMITAVTYNNVVKFMDNVKCYGYCFYYSNPFALVSTLELEYYVKTGFVDGVNGKYPTDILYPDKLLGLSMSPNLEYSTSDLEHARFNVLMQTPHPCANFLDLALLKDVEKMPIPRHYLAEDKDEFAKSVEYDDETEGLTSKYPFPIRVLEELYTTSGKYTLATICPSEDYDSICKSISKLTSIDILESVVYIDKIEQGWQHCKITGIMNHILTWEHLE